MILETIPTYVSKPLEIELNIGQQSMSHKFLVNMAIRWEVQIQILTLPQIPTLLLTTSY